MKIEPEKVKAFLLHMEDERNKAPDMTRQEGLEYAVFMKEAGYIDACVQKGNLGVPIGCIIKGITPAGRDYLRSLEAQSVPCKVWNILKWGGAIAAGAVLSETVRLGFSFLEK